MDILTAVMDKVAVEEKKFRDILHKQANIEQLFPTFKDRVAAISHGELFEEEPGLLHFKVEAVTTPGVDNWDVYVQFLNMVQNIKMFGQRKDMWKKDGSGIDLDKLAEKILRESHMRIWCSCPCNQYWGFAYIQTLKQTKYGDPENRRPTVKNTDMRGTGCKHLQYVFNLLPGYKATIASHLNRFFNKDIKKVEVGIKGERAKFKGAAGALQKKEEAPAHKPVSYGRGGKPVETPEDKGKPEQKPEKGGTAYGKGFK